MPTATKTMRVEDRARLHRIADKLEDLLDDRSDRQHAPLSREDAKLLLRLIEPMAAKQGNVMR